MHFGSTCIFGLSDGRSSGRDPGSSRTLRKIGVSTMSVIDLEICEPWKLARQKLRRTEGLRSARQNAGTQRALSTPLERGQKKPRAWPAVTASAGKGGTALVFCQMRRSRTRLADKDAAAFSSRRVRNGR